MAAAAFKNKYLSYTRLERFEDCPKAFELHYVRKEPSEPNGNVLFGGLMHQVLEDYFRSKWEASGAPGVHGSVYLRTARARGPARAVGRRGRAWREPKLVIAYVVDEKGRKLRTSVKPVLDSTLGDADAA